MKKLLPFFLLILSLSVFSQVPTYYNDVNLNQTGVTLKDALATKIISTHTTVLTYTPDVWNALKQTDIDPTNSNKVVLIYGWNDTDSDITNDRTRDKDLHGSGSGVWNREHVYSKSLANPNLGTTGPGADAHNLRPCDAQRNSSRSNRKFATGSGNSGATPEGHWYPGDEWKGDVARMMMYMYLRYGNQTLPTGVGVGNTLPTDPNMIDLFLQWNAEDPISDIEKQRNPVLEQMQGNRNPFVDNPAFATQIWGGPQAENIFGNGGGGSSDTEAPTIPSDVVVSNITQTTVDLTWTNSTDNTAVSGYNIFSGSTQIGNTATDTNFVVSNLTAGISYTFSIKAYDTAGNVSLASDIVNITTTSDGTGGNGTTTELLISEYVEGSSYNKAIEIANFTGTTVNLTDYSIKKATNGGGTWASTLTLSGSLNNGQVYVIAHGSASQEILNKANITNNSIMSFNGNDAVALFKGNTLIDLIGDPNSSTTFAQDKTLQRKSSISLPSTAYVNTQWDVLASNTFSGLGTHSIDGGSADIIAPTAPANLITSNLTQTSVDLAWTASTDNIAVIGYEIFQNDIKITTTTINNYSVTDLDVETAYNYSIKAIDAAGNISNLSNKVFITTLAAPDTTTPSTPADLTVSNVTETTADLTWTASTDNIGVTGYDIYQGNTKITTVATTNYSVTGLIAATNYTFYVKAIDEAGNVSTASNTIGITTQSAIDSIAPTAPNNLVVSNVTETTSDLAWTASTDNIAVTGYDIYKGTTKIATVTTTSYNVTSLIAATNYTFSIKAKDAAGNISIASNVVGVTTKSPTTNTSTILSQSYFESGWDNWTDGGNDCARYSGSLSYEGNRSIRLRDNSGVASSMTSQTHNLSSYDTVEIEFYFYSYSMETGEDFWLRYYDGNSWQTVETYVSGTDFENTSFYTATVVLNKANYNFANNAQFRFQNDASANADQIFIDQVTITGKTGDFSARNTIVNSKTTHIRYYDSGVELFEADFKTFPNPVSGDVLNIRLNGSDIENVTYSIFSILGQVVAKGNLTNDYININNLNAGIYLLEINDGEEKMIQKFIKK